MTGSGRALLYLAGDPPFFRSTISVPVQCRCGTLIPNGGTAFGVTAASPSSEELFRDQLFCSVRCIGAFCLESLEVLDPLDTPASEAVVSDLHELHREVLETLASAMGRRAVPTGRG